MSYYTNDRGPKSIPFTVVPATTIDITEVSSARLRVVLPDESVEEWTTSALTVDESRGEVSFLQVLQSDGAQLSQSGTYSVRVWLYDDADEYLWDSDEAFLFDVKTARITWPT